MPNSKNRNTLSEIDVPLADYIRVRIGMALSRPTLKAKLRGLWYWRYAYEMCDTCARPVLPHTGSWWHAENDLWGLIVGDPVRVLCPPCFTEMSLVKGFMVYWAPRAFAVPRKDKDDSQSAS